MGVDCRSAVRAIALAAAVLLAACQVAPPRKSVLPPRVTPQIKTITVARYERVDFRELPIVAEADVMAAWPALVASCRAFERNRARHAAWLGICADLATVPTVDALVLRGFLAQRFDAWRMFAITREDSAPDGSEPRLFETVDRGRITGYYEPLLNGSRQAVAPFTIPLYRAPDDLLSIELGALAPELQGRRLRGRIDGRRVVPYWTRAEIENGERLRGAELVWVDDPIAAFFLQIQGSGRVRLTDGSVVRVGYADVNGHPYRSIGRVLIDRGELAFEQASMQGIQSWARANPARLRELLDQNASYVFFRELPLGDPNAGPIGAFNVALTPGYSIAVDPKFVPLGAPLVIRTTHPDTSASLERLVLAQDTGGAIRGPLRFDLFWGFGAEAGATAGKQRHDAAAWLLLPRGVKPEELLK